MRRREFVKSIGSAAVMWPLAAGAQQPTRLPVIGFLDSRSPEAVVGRLRAFRQGLKETGYVDGENVTIVYRWAENQFDRLPQLAADLVGRRVAVITVGGASPTFAAKTATSTIPVVFLMGDDPIDLGLVASLARPGGNLTGVSILTIETVAKRLELLRELSPKITRIAVLTNPAAGAATTEATLREGELAARSMGLQIQVFIANTSREIDTAFENMGSDRADALFVTTTPFLNARVVQLAQLATFHRLPAIHALREYAEVGGLISYGPNIEDAYRQAGIYAGRILNGAKPTDLPVVQASKLELVINAPTARMLGIAVPQTLLVAADEVIE